VPTTYFSVNQSLIDNEPPIVVESPIHPLGSDCNLIVTRDALQLMVEDEAASARPYTTLLLLLLLLLLPPLRVLPAITGSIQ
jgi:hypothetical protein